MTIDLIIEVIFKLALIALIGFCIWLAITDYYINTEIKNDVKELNDKIDKINGSDSDDEDNNKL